MSMKILLNENKPFFKANLHCHSTNSDGHYTVEELKVEYKKRGYSIVAFTDHEHVIDNSHLDDKDFLTVTSCEAAIKPFPDQSTLKNFQMPVVHLNFYALDQHNALSPCYEKVYDHYGVPAEIEKQIRYEGEYHRVYSADGINEMIRIGKEKGFIVAYNHPSWSLENATQYLGYDGLFAVEIYNNACEQNGDDEHVFDDMLRSGKNVFCTATDDNHNPVPFSDVYSDSFGGWTCINAERLEYGEIMGALQKGDFYASTGPQIFSLIQNENAVEIKTSPCKTITLLTKGRRTVSVKAADGETLRFAKFTLREDDGYFRIRITDENGKRAFTQAYPLFKTIK